VESSTSSEVTETTLGENTTEPDDETTTTELSTGTTTTSVESETTTTVIGETTTTVPCVSENDDQGEDSNLQQDAAPVGLNSADGQNNDGQGQDEVGTPPSDGQDHECDEANEGDQGENEDNPPTVSTSTVPGTLVSGGDQGTNRGHD
jgi:hypothetical protein